MRRFVPLFLAVILVAACSETPAEPQAERVLGATGEAATPLFNSGNGVVERVSVGSNDACEAFGLPNGCDGNFSLTAHEKADGTVAGQWHDTFSGGGEGIHVAIDCLNTNDNWAVVGGVITHGTIGGVDVSGQQALTAAVDNGTSANDAPDQISYAFNGQFTPGACLQLTPANFPLFDLTTGQVTVKYVVCLYRFRDSIAWINHGK